MGWGGLGGGVSKRENLQISDLQKLTSLHRCGTDVFH